MHACHAVPASVTEASDVKHREPRTAPHGLCPPSERMIDLVPRSRVVCDGKTDDDLSAPGTNRFNVVLRSRLGIDSVAIVAVDRTFPRGDIYDLFVTSLAVRYEMKAYAGEFRV